MKKEFKPMAKKELQNEEILNANIENNKIIYEHLEKFREINNLDKHDFVIVGSACASYMQYLAITHFKDIDVCLFDYDKHPNLVKTDHIDLLHIPFLLKDYKDRIQEKDGYLFVSALDFTSIVTCAVLYRIMIKPSHLTYSKLMIKELGFTKEEFKEFILRAIEKLDDNDYAYLKKRIMEKYPKIDEIYADVFASEEENNNGE